jgi:hypothetical protein
MKRLARAMYLGEATLAKKLPQGRETAAANTASAGIGSSANERAGSSSRKRKRPSSRQAGQWKM